jgi:hypothetical protein
MRIDKLQIKVITSSPEGFGSTPRSSRVKKSYLIDAQFTLNDASRLAAAIA